MTRRSLKSGIFLDPPFRIPLWGTVIRMGSLDVRSEVHPAGSVPSDKPSKQLSAWHSYSCNVAGMCIIYAAMHYHHADVVCCLLACPTAPISLASNHNFDGRVYSLRPVASSAAACPRRYIRERPFFRAGVFGGARAMDQKTGVFRWDGGRGHFL